MKTQKEIFQSTEGDQWFLRNKEAYKKLEHENDLILQSLKKLEIVPKKILEVGCSNGIRLNNLHKTFGSECYGIDPSVQAIESGKSDFPKLTLQVGTADVLPFENQIFDTIIFGFCLYLCDRKDLFKIAYEADRCLANGGHIVIMDFSPPFPYKNIYTHQDGICSYKMNYANLFNWNPAYNEIYNNISSHYGVTKRHIPNEKVAVTILNKNEEFAYPLEPYQAV